MRLAQRFWSDETAAVAPTLALIMFVLVAAGGIAFDYSRLATLDTELQNAADQAALAAAGQLDGLSGAQNRATSAAQNLVRNLTYFANDDDSDGTNVRVTTVEFYSTYDAGRANLATAPGTAATGDENSNYVRVTVESRRANFALTPVVAAFGGNATAHALAGLGSAWCNVPPFMICQPTSNFDPDAHIGAGMRLVIGAPTTAGNFGFLQTGFGTGASALAQAIGYNGSYGGCVATNGVTTEPGDKDSVRAAFNTRFDMSESGLTCPTGGTCSPSMNSRKDLVHPSDNACGISGQQAWQEAPNPYRAPNSTPLSSTNPMDSGHTYPDIMGHPRDLCHAVSQSGSCAGGIVGDGNWDRDAFFHVNYGWDSATSGTANAWTTRTGLSANATRWQVYQWEAAHTQPDGPTGGGLANQQVVSSSTGNGNGNGNDNGKGKGGGSGGGSTLYGNGAPVCRPPGIAVSNSDNDRRRTTVAIVNCSGLTGRDFTNPIGWMDVFLVEPAFARGTGANARTGDGDIYVEIIGSRIMPGINQTSGNIVRRDVPRLLE